MGPGWHPRASGVLCGPRVLRAAHGLMSPGCAQGVPTCGQHGAFAPPHPHSDPLSWIPTRAFIIPRGMLEGSEMGRREGLPFPRSPRPPVGPRVAQRSVLKDTPPPPSVPTAPRATPTHATRGRPGVGGATRNVPGSGHVTERGPLAGAVAGRGQSEKADIRGGGATTLTGSDANSMAMGSGVAGGCVRSGPRGARSAPVPSPHSQRSLCIKTDVY